jgi:hypothetical protein
VPTQTVRTLRSYLMGRRTLMERIEQQDMKQLQHR